EQSEPAVIIDRLRAESLSPCQDAADRKPSAGEFLRDKAVFEYTKPHTAVLGWNGNAEPALRGHLIDKTPRHLPLLGIKLVSNWEHDILGKRRGPQAAVRRARRFARAAADREVAALGAFWSTCHLELQTRLWRQRAA